MQDWFKIDDPDSLSTPALLIFPKRIEENIKRMITIAGDPSNLRPHVKTHKMSEVIKLQMRQGITKFKCSTIAEAEMTAEAGAGDVLLAMQPVGPHTRRFLDLTRHYPDVRFSVIADSLEIIKNLNNTWAGSGEKIGLWLDINNGMDRTGIRPGREALEMYLMASELPNIKMCGLHVYDGHIHDRVPDQRRKHCENDLIPVYGLIKQLIASGLAEPVMAAGGTPTFPLHARRKNTEAGPGTCLLWDYGYSEGYKDLEFLHAAILLTRVVSKPGKGLLCLDLGHKSLSAEMPHPRIKLLNIEVDGFVNHSEEHLVIQTTQAEKYEPGDVLYGIPWHICPTVPRFPFAYTVENRRVTGQWNVDARDRRIKY